MFVIEHSKCENKMLKSLYFMNSKSHMKHSYTIYHIFSVFTAKLIGSNKIRNANDRAHNTPFMHTYLLFERKKRILFANIAHRSYKIIMERNICVYIHEIWPIVCSSLFAFISNILILIKQNLWPQAILLFIWFLFFLFFFSFPHSHSFAEYQNEHRYLRYA